jgi:hypothetical protein
MAPRTTAPCLRCNELIETSEAAIIADIRLRTVGMEDSIRSPQASVSICVTCADLMSKGDEPPQRTQPLNHIVYELLQEMVTNDPSFTFLSWIEMRKGRGLPVANFLEPKFLKAWADFRKSMALPPTLERVDTEAPEGKRLKAG